ncbi:MAG: divalent-cation tolerance protein CutA [Pseudomonadota bacterium]
MTKPQAALIYSPLPDAETARAIAGTLLDEGLIVCANVLGAVESVYLWKGRRESATECGVLFKTTAGKMEQAVNRLGALHPYEVPAIIANVCDTAHKDTLTWLSEQTG